MGLALFYWVIGYLMASSSLSVYLEFASYFPSRSGSEVVYLEQSYPRPKYFFPTVFAMQTVLFSFSSSNAVGGFTLVPASGLRANISVQFWHNIYSSSLTRKLHHGNSKGWLWLLTQLQYYVSQAKPRYTPGPLLQRRLILLY